MQWLAECGLTRVSRLIQACDVSRRKGEGESDRMIVYLISGLKERQVLTRSNLFHAAETEDRLAVSADAC